MDDFDSDPIVKALERSTIAQTLKAARASLAEPSRPFTPLDRSLFQISDGGGASASRPSSSYSVDQLSFVRDTYGGRPESARSSRSSRTGRYETIAEEGEGYHRDGGADVLRLDGDEVASRGSRRPSPQDSEEAASSGSEELTPVTSAGAAPSPPAKGLIRPPRPPGADRSGYPAAAPTSSVRLGGYPLEPQPPATVSDASPRKAGDPSPRRHRSGDPSPRRRKASSSPAPPGSASPSASGSASTPPGTPRRAWDAACEAVLAKLQALSANKEKKKKGAELLLQLCERIWDLALDIKAGKGTKSEEYAPRLLREVMGLMDLKEPKCIFKLARCAFVLLQMEGATHGVNTTGVQAAYLNIAQVLFKFSQREGHDRDFLEERLFEPLLEVLQSEAPACASSDLRVFIVGVLKNTSHEEQNQRFLAEHGALGALFKLLSGEHLTGSSKEAQLLIQITATLRNLASHEHEQFLDEDRLNVLTRVMALFPGNIELLTNISRIHAKLTLHTAACEAFAKSDVHIRQIARTLSAHADTSAPLALRLAFVLGNLTERSDRLRVIFAFDCEGTALVPQLLGKYWRKERQLARIELEKGQAKASGLQEVEEVLVKLVRLLANIAISATAGSTLASSSAVVDPLLDMLGAKRISESEELVLNVVAAVTNLLFYDVPSNLLFQEENKQLLCRLFRPLLLESYNVEALIETTRALGNLSRHADARRCMGGLRLDEILVILLDHDDRDLVFYVCGALVNLAADPDCTGRLMGSCPVVAKLSKLLGDAPMDDPALQLVAVKVLTNLSLDPNVAWSAQDLEVSRGVLESTVADVEAAAGGQEEETEEADDTEAERQQLLDLAGQLLARLPKPELAEAEPEAAVTGFGGSTAGPEAATAPVSPPRRREGPGEAAGAVAAGGHLWVCPVEGCGRSFPSEAKLTAHIERRHPAS